MEQSRRLTKQSRLAACGAVIADPPRRYLIQIVPHLPPATSGVGDYALLLAKGLLEESWRTTFVVANEHRDRVLESHDVVGLREGDRASALVDALERCGAAVVLLHYSGYGYALRGAPLWLTRGLRRWKHGAAPRWLVVMFHELWAFGPPWRSSFWLSAHQRRVVKDLVNLADSSLTNTGVYAAQIQRFRPNSAPVVVLPVLSNIGEPVRPPSLDAREPFAVVFGQQYVRGRVYAHIEDFEPTLRSAEIEAIVDIGPPLEGCATDRSTLPVVRRGYLDAPSASAIMLGARFGLLDYALDRAAKSGTLAAYAAHGLVPLIRSAVDGAPDGLRHGVNLVRAGEPIPHLRTVAQPLATAAHLWYGEHALERTAACFAEIIRSHSS